MTLSSLLVDAASAQPDNEALVGLSDRQTWATYERATAAIAGRLLASGVRAGDRVAIGFTKDTRSYLAVHGVLRAGAVVVPIDPLSPPTVARAVIEDAEVAAVCCDERTYRRLDPWSIDPLDLRLALVDGQQDERTASWADALAVPGVEHLPSVRADDPAYLIYTSGSTGRPKGILHTHASAMAYAERAVEAHGLQPHDRIGGMSPFHFDMSTLELYAAPLAGAATVVFGEAHLRMPASFTARSAAERVSVWYTVPAFLRQVVERGAVETRDLGSLRLVMYGGEPYSGGALAELVAMLPGVAIDNVYGPAEVNECTFWHLDASVGPGIDVPIGRAWRDVELMVVDDGGRAVPPGTPGELWVSAPTVMAGYWGRADLSARSLHPRDNAPPWYATGDVVVADADGVFWFKGRKDHQVKVRGVRVELEAVELVLTDAPEVLHAVVGAAPTPVAATHLVAAVVVRDGATFDADALRHHCAARLPAQAVPREIQVWPSFPTTATSKIDRRSVRIGLATTQPEDDVS